MVSSTAAVIFTLFLSGTAIAAPEVGDSYAEQAVPPENLVIDSQPLDVNTVPVAQETVELTAVSEPEVTSPAPMKLALADSAIATGQGIVDAVSPLNVVDGESSQMPFALILALLALIAVVPMSRRH